MTKLDQRVAGVRVSEVMTPSPVTVHRETTIAEVARVMLERDIGCVLVVDDRGLLVGILTESDFAARERGVQFSVYRFPQVFGEWLDHPVEEILSEAAEKPVSEFMTKHPFVAREDDSFTDVVALMARGNRRRIPIVRDGIPVGIVTRHDILRLLARKSDAADET